MRSGFVDERFSTDSLKLDETGARADQHHRRRPRRQPHEDPQPSGRGEGRGRRPRPLPRTRRPGLPAGGPAAAPRVHPRSPPLARRDRARGARNHGARRVPPVRPRPLQRLRDLHGRRGQGRLPQALPPQLRRLRRGPVLRGRALARERGTIPEAEVVHIGAPRAHNGRPAQRPIAPRLSELEQMRLALELGLRDYVEKNGFRDLVIGVSGGIDSALTAALAVEALGAERVHCVSMPSRHSSEGTRADARHVAENLGASLAELPIDAVRAAFEQTLAEQFAGRDPDLAEENLQARIRGTMLMALSNKFGWLVVATGNKSELSVGYATLYGDLAGGFALLKDVFKTDVFRLAKHVNERAGTELIPQTIIDRAPSAELREHQLDEDSLPPYPALDKVLAAYVEEDRSAEELSADGFDPEVVERAVAMIDRAEYKRRQAPPGVRLRPKAFGRARRATEHR